MKEYLVEVEPGREQAYRTALAFRAAMRAGEIRPYSRIYHRAASRWIPITEHPEYRRFLAERRPPDWLQPIPFEPVEPSQASIEGRWALAAVKAAFARAGAGLRDWFIRLVGPAPEPTPAATEPRVHHMRFSGSVEPPAPPPPPPASPPATKEAVAPSPQRKGWTFMP
jgi:hypothetical protein